MMALAFCITANANFSSSTFDYKTDGLQSLLDQTKKYTGGFYGMGRVAGGGIAINVAGKIYLYDFYESGIEKRAKVNKNLKLEISP